MARECSVPEWQVYYGVFFGETVRGQRAGQEVSLGKTFVWEGEEWQIPAVYLCGKGLVVDFLCKVSAEKVQSFIEKWQLNATEEENLDFTSEQRIWLEQENPLTVDMHPDLSVNGTRLSAESGCGLCWNPCFPEKNGERAKIVVQHYQLDADAAWVVERRSFAWNTKRKPDIKTISVTLAAGKTALPGPHFSVQAAGEQVEFVHPVTHVKHTLTIEKYESIHDVNLLHRQNDAMEYPCYLVAMGYTVQPALSSEQLQILDCTESDLPRSPQGVPGRWNNVSGFFVSFGEETAALRSAVSSLHFEPVTHVAWRMVFYEQLKPDITVELIS